jgi:hypothetical protein
MAINPEVCHDCGAQLTRDERGHVRHNWVMRRHPTERGMVLSVPLCDACWAVEKEAMVRRAQPQRELEPVTELVALTLFDLEVFA